MRLERLEISGFKSFSDRAELAFDRGVTAIVGPNGCGKSNVADAITWVLGEQSAKSLRGDKMEDVIFGGSDARKPGGAAEVRLRLTGLPVPPRPSDSVAPADISTFAPFPGAPAAGPDAHGDGNGHEHAAAGNGHANGHGNGNGNGNGNGHGYANGHHAPPAIADAGTIADLAQAFTRDVEVTRRLYRSGESEYLIDGESCRLRDVHELLMDTGLGAKAYAIIEQGKIGMILSSRPADRRQLIEEAAGITKYRSRRRAAELKLEAAQQNLTRIDDIVFEVEKQRGTLKRQAAKARRYARLRDELRRWEKVLFAGRYRQLAQAIESARTRLAEARGRETAAAAHVAALEADLSRLRIEQAEADAAAARLREDAHARELDINRRQQQQAFSRQQADALAERRAAIAAEIADLETRREPARLSLLAGREAALAAEQARDASAATLQAAVEDQAQAAARLEGLDADVEHARADVFTQANAVTALAHAVDHARAQFERVGETLARLDVEQDDLRREMAATASAAGAAAEARRQVEGSLERVAAERAARDAALVSLRGAHEERTREVRAREQEVAGAEARLTSLQDLAASRAEFGDAARMVLVEAAGQVGHQGAVADYIEVDRRFERAVEACLGDVLQHVIVERHDQASAGLALVRERDAGRCGFVVAGGTADLEAPAPVHAPGITPVSELVRVSGAYAATIRRVVAGACVADSFEQAVAFSRTSDAPVATMDGDVCRGPHLVSGGGRVESRGILGTRREIKDLADELAAGRTRLAAAAADVHELDTAIAEASAAIVALQAEHHRQEMARVALDAQLARADEDGVRHRRRGELLASERRSGEEERAALESRRVAAEAAIVERDRDRLVAEEALGAAQRRLAAARETVAELSSRAAEARAANAALVERAAAHAADVVRMEDAARDLEVRIEARTVERDDAGSRREALLTEIAHGERALDGDIRGLDTLRAELVDADARATEHRAAVDGHDGVIREARRALEATRVEASDLDVARATSEADLTHLAQTCVDHLQVTLDDVLADVERMEAAGETTPDPTAIAGDETDAEAEDGERTAEPADAGVDAAGGIRDASADGPVSDLPAPAALTAEEAIARLKGKIDRLGPVNMMAIQQSDELEARHAFLTTQRRDLVESIAQTAEAIQRIDETTKVRFAEAFAAIQGNFQLTFSTLFGGGRAGLTLLDADDPLESGIDIVASPPGKRLQNVQLLSGGEKALTAIALMFAIFRYKPSPFCLLDEIDAPLDDANVGRFVDMLRGMLDRTQFILITHNRRTMEIANRLYGVTMEEPGVSKLISVQLH